MNLPPLPPPAPAEWTAHRRALHARVAAVERLIGPSQIAWMRGSPRVWSEDELADLWRTAASQSGSAAANHLYVHVPFCKSICAFCNYDRLKPSSAEGLRDWRDRVLASIRTLGPAVRGLRFQSLYFGGGTPSVLPSAILREVFEGLDSHFHWKHGASRSIELDPATVNAPKIEAMLDHRFDHFSFGVQTRSTQVNVHHNRGPQGEATVDRCLDLLPGPLTSSVAVDVLMGLAGVSPDDTLADVEALMRHPRRPSIDLFHLTPTRDYVQSHFGGSSDRAATALAQYDDHFRSRLAQLARVHGYGLRDAHSHHAHALYPHRRHWLASVKDLRELGRQLGKGVQSIVTRIRAGRPGPRLPGPRYGYTQLANNAGQRHNLLGLGPSARSQLFGIASAQTIPAAGQEGPTAYRGSAIDLTDELRTFIIFDIRDRAHIDEARLHKIFRTTLAEAFPHALSVWLEEGFAQPAPGGWSFHRKPPPELSQLMLWLVPESTLEETIARKSGGRAGARARQNRPSPARRP